MVGSGEAYNSAAAAGKANRRIPRRRSLCAGGGEKYTLLQDRPEQNGRVMAEETIYCPACNRKLRVPEEMLGQPVQCPLCRSAFVAPLRGPAVPPGEPPLVLPAPAARPPAEPLPPSEAQVEAALTQLRPPATTLLALGVLGWFANVIQAFRVKWQGLEGAAEQVADFQKRLRTVPPSPERDMLERLFTPEFLYNFQLSLALLFLIICTCIIIGATQMLRLRRYWMAVLGSILAMVNINECCCVLGLPFGIWCLVVLMRPEVRRAFE